MSNNGGSKSSIDNGVQSVVKSKTTERSSTTTSTNHHHDRQQQQQQRISMTATTTSSQQQQQRQNLLFAKSQKTTTTTNKKTKLLSSTQPLSQTHAYLARVLDDHEKNPVLKKKKRNIIIPPPYQLQQQRQPTTAVQSSLSLASLQQLQVKQQHPSQHHKRMTDIFGLPIQKENESINNKMTSNNNYHSNIKLKLIDTHNNKDNDIDIKSKTIIESSSASSLTTKTMSKSITTITPPPIKTTTTTDRMLMMIPTTTSIKSVKKILKNNMKKMNHARNDSTMKIKKKKNDTTTITKTTSNTTMSNDTMIIVKDVVSRNSHINIKKRKYVNHDNYDMTKQIVPIIKGKDNNELSSLRRIAVQPSPPSQQQQYVGNGSTSICSGININMIKQQHHHPKKLLSSKSYCTKKSFLSSELVLVSDSSNNYMKEENVLYFVNDENNNNSQKHTRIKEHHTATANISNNVNNENNNKMDCNDSIMIEKENYHHKDHVVEENKKVSTVMIQSSQEREGNIHDQELISIDSNTKKIDIMIPKNPIRTINSTSNDFKDVIMTTKAEQKRRINSYHLPKKSNLVRMNLKNHSGACRHRHSHGQNHNKPNKWKTRMQQQNQYQNQYRNKQIDNDNEDDEDNIKQSIIDTIKSGSSGGEYCEMIDPVDDYIDGNYTKSKNNDTKNTSTKTKKITKKTTTTTTTTTKPICPQHQLVCKLCTVKKSGPNHGRQFYVCSMQPRSEQCRFFLWKDNTQQSIREALHDNQSTSCFITRYVANYIKSIQSLTIPELKTLCIKNNISLHEVKKKSQLLTRLAIWVRDEIASSNVTTDIIPILNNKKDEISQQLPKKGKLSCDDRDEKLNTPCQNVLPCQDTKMNHEEDVDNHNDSCIVTQTVDDPKLEEKEEFLNDSNMMEKIDENSIPCQDVPCQDLKMNEDADNNDDSFIVMHPVDDLKPQEKELADDSNKVKNIEEINDDDGDSNDDEDEDDDDTIDSNSSDDEELEIIGDSSSRTQLDLHRSSSSSSSLSSKDRLQQVLYELFGYQHFRNGQEWAIRRCLRGQRSLLVAPTGFGKSLCYTIPAYMMNSTGVCIVVSPLVSLIQDQMRYIPASIPTATLSGSISHTSLAITLDDIQRGRIKILFVSPERLTSSSFRRLFRKKRQWNYELKRYNDGDEQRLFPNVSLLCIDEAHCLSQWAHNFRPSYLRLRSVIDIIEPNSVLAITATAGPKVVHDICRSLQIDEHESCHTSTNQDDNPDNTTDESIQNDKVDDNNDNQSVQIQKTDRDNIDVKCLLLHSPEERISKLIKILSKTATKGDHATSNERGRKSIDSNCTLDGCLSNGCVIVYVWRQRDAEIVAENIQAASNQIHGGVVVYHGGMDAAQREKAQTKFMRNKARICVATIAFGLGINKPDVAGVVHMYLSSSPEHYIQEIGRGGRDGRKAQAIALVLAEEVLIKHSLAYTDSITLYQMNTILNNLRDRIHHIQSILPETRCQNQPIYVSIPCNDAITKFGCKVETIETIMSLLEQRDYNNNKSLLVIEGISYDNAYIIPKRRSLEQLAEFEPIAAAILQCATIITKPTYNNINAPSTTSSFSDDNKSRIMNLQSSNKTSFHSMNNNNDLHYEKKQRDTSDDPIFGSYSFSIVECANCFGGEPRQIFAILQRLEINHELQFHLQTKPTDRSFTMRMTIEGMNVFQQKPSSSIVQDDNMSANTLNAIVQETYDRFHSTIRCSANKVVDMNCIMRRVSEVTITTKTNKVDDTLTKKDDNNKSKSLQLFQHLIEQYFKAEGTDETLVSLLQNDQADQLIFTNEFNSNQLCQNTLAVISYCKDLFGGGQQQQETSTNNMSISLSNKEYASMLVTKFLHGTTILIPGGDNTYRQHPLFGTMQHIHYEVLNQAIHKILAEHSYLLL